MASPKLASRNPVERLCGHSVKAHPFLDPLQDLWDDIAALKYPPFSRGLVPELDSDIGLDLRVYGGQDSEGSHEGPVSTNRLVLPNRL